MAIMPEFGSRLGQRSDSTQIPTSTARSVRSSSQSIRSSAKARLSGYPKNDLPESSGCIPLEGFSCQAQHARVDAKLGSEESDKSSSIWSKVGFYWATGGVVAVLGIALTLFLALRHPDSEPPPVTQQPAENEPVIDSVQVSPRSKGTSLNVTGHGWDTLDKFDLYVIARPPGEQRGSWQTSPPAQGEPGGTWRTIFVVRPPDIDYVLIAVLVKANAGCPTVCKVTSGAVCAPEMECPPGTVKTELVLNPDGKGVVYLSPRERVDA
jgi:hypothetical protein